MTLVRSLCLVSVITPLMTPLAPPRCTGTARIRITDPNSGIQGTAEVEWKKEVKTGKVRATIPPGAQQQVLQVGGCTITLPANQGTQPMPFEASCEDPLIVQIPAGWSLATATVTTPLGTGSIVSVPGPYPAFGVILPTGAVAFTSYYTPEPGAQLLMGDYPPGLVADGDTRGYARFDIPPGPSATETIKVISAGKLTLYTPFGPVVWYPPLDPPLTNFALVTAEPYKIAADALAGTECTASGSAAASATMQLPASDWQVGSATSLDAAGFSPGAPVAFVVGTTELLPPLSLWRPGCSLRTLPAASLLVGADPAGNVSLPLAVPGDPLLRGAVTVWQAASIDRARQVVLSSHLKARIE